MPVPAQAPPAALQPPAPMPPVAPRPAFATRTADISEHVPRNLLPFTQEAPAPPKAPSAPPPMPAAPAGKRWLRFDPQTGEPLPAAVLVDVGPEKR
jgi:hypothetical protein